MQTLQVKLNPAYTCPTSLESLMLPFAAAFGCCQYNGVANAAYAVANNVATVLLLQQPLLELPWPPPKYHIN